MFCRLGGSPYRHLFLTFLDVVSETCFYTKKGTQSLPLGSLLGLNIGKHVSGRVLNNSSKNIEKVPTHIPKELCDQPLFEEICDNLRLLCGGGGLRCPWPQHSQNMWLFTIFSRFIHHNSMKNRLPNCIPSFTATTGPGKTIQHSASCCISFRGRIRR